MGNNEWSKARSQEHHTLPCIPMDDCNALPFMQPEEHHQISNSDKVHENIIQFAHKNLLDPAVKVGIYRIILKLIFILHQNFLPDLKDHILGHLSDHDVDIDYSFTDVECVSLQIVGNQLYHHGTLHVNYTTYDMRCNQDSINPKTHLDILMLAPSSPQSQSPHPYLYGQVIGIYHVDIIHANLSPHSQCIEFLHVRFFQVDEDFQGSFKSRRFYRLSFAEADDVGAFGFIDPARVI